MRAKTDKKTKDKAPAEGVYALHKSESIHHFHQGYSHGAELWDDGNIVTVDFIQARFPTSLSRRFSTGRFGTKGAKTIRVQRARVDCQSVVAAVFYDNMSGKSATGMGLQLGIFTPMR
eukprot:3930161-Pyramimonas_sp.AAC.1